MQLAACHVTVNSLVNPPVCTVLLRTGDPPPLACSPHSALATLFHDVLFGGLKHHFQMRVLQSESPSFFPGLRIHTSICILNIPT